MRLTVGAGYMERGWGKGRARVQLCHARDEFGPIRSEFGHSVPRVGATSSAPDPAGRSEPWLRCARALSAVSNCRTRLDEVGQPLGVGQELLGRGHRVDERAIRRARRVHCREAEKEVEHERAELRI